MDFPQKQKKNVFCGTSCARKAMWAARPEMRAAQAALMVSLRAGKAPWNVGVPWSDAHRASISESAKARGQNFSVRGGNGRPPPLAEQLIGSVLPAGFVNGVVVPTKAARSSGLPGHFKLDWASHSRMVCLEVQGNSHRRPMRVAQDARKKEFLESLGWIVLTITNAQVFAMFGTSKSKTRTAIS
jgi:hypothetical protein